jgi:hypothetical protein
MIVAPRTKGVERIILCIAEVFSLTHVGTISVARGIFLCLTFLRTLSLSARRLRLPARLDLRNRAWRLPDSGPPGLCKHAADYARWCNFKRGGGQENRTTIFYGCSKSRGHVLRGRGGGASAPLSSQPNFSRALRAVSGLGVLAGGN